MKTRKDGMECIENPVCNMCTQYSAPPTHRADSLAHRQSENPMAQTSDGPPPQTLHAQSDPTTSTRLWKLPTHLNTPNIFVPWPPSLSKRFRRPMVGPVCGGLYIAPHWSLEVGSQRGAFNLKAETVLSLSTQQQANPTKQLQRLRRR